MKELQKIEKEVKVLEELLIYNPQYAKKHKNDYKNYTSNLIEIVNTYIEDISEIFEKYCEDCVIVWTGPTDNLMQRIKRSIDISIIYHKLNVLSLGLSKAGVLKYKLTKIEERFIQFQYLCTN